MFSNIRSYIVKPLAAIRMQDHMIPPAQDLQVAQVSLKGLRRPHGVEVAILEKFGSRSCSHYTPSALSQPCRLHLFTEGCNARRRENHHSIDDQKMVMEMAGQLLGAASKRRVGVSFLHHPGWKLLFRLR